MGAPEFVPVPPAIRALAYESPDYVPSPWRAARPAELAGRQPAGRRLGYQGPDQGYALTIAERFRDRLVLGAGEHADDALAGAVAIATRRASLFGRGPVVHDVELALTIWGFLDASAPAELVAARRRWFEGAASSHHYFERRDLADAVPEATLRLAAGAARDAYRSGRWRDLVGA